MTKATGTALKAFKPSFKDTTVVPFHLDHFRGFNLMPGPHQGILTSWNLIGTMIITTLPILLPEGNITQNIVKSLNKYHKIEKHIVNPYCFNVYTQLTGMKIQ